MSNYNLNQVVLSHWQPMSQLLLSQVQLSPELFNEINYVLNTQGIELAYDFVNYEAMTQQLSNENIKNIVASIVGYTITSVLQKYNYQCPMFMEETNYVNKRKYLVNQMVNASMQQQPVGNSFIYAPNSNVQPAGSYSIGQPIQSQANARQSPLTQSNGGNVNTQSNQQKGEDMERNSHLLQVNPNNYKFNQNEQVLTTPAEQKVTAPVTPITESNTEEVNTFLQTRVVNQLQSVICPEMKLDLPIVDKHSGDSYLSCEDALADVQLTRSVSLFTKIDVKNMLVPKEAASGEPLRVLIDFLGVIDNIDEVKRLLTELKNEYESTNLLSWVSNHLTQYVLLALNDLYGLQESGFPFLTNPDACDTYLKGGNSLGKDISEPIYQLIVRRINRLFESMTFSTFNYQDKEFYLLEAILFKPVLIFPWILNYRKTDKTLAVIINNQRILISHLLEQSFASIDDTVLFIDIVDSAGNEYRAFRGSRAQYAPVNYRILQSLV